MQCNGMVWHGMVCVYMWVNVCVQIHIEHAVMLDQLRLRFYHSRAAQQLIQDIMDGRDPRVQMWIYVQGIAFFSDDKQQVDNGIFGYSTLFSDIPVNSG